MKKILYIDMDGVIADFDGSIKLLCPELETGDNFPDYESRRNKVDEIVETNPSFFRLIAPIHGAIESVDELFYLYDVYFLSTPMWNVPSSFMEKRLWIEDHFGDRAHKRLILSHRKDLCIGDFLIDDRLRNGAAEFKGEHIHFGTDNFPDWKTTLEYLKDKELHGRL